MIAWSERSRLVAHFLNPALIAGVIVVCASDYQRARSEPMPWVLSFLVAPLVLHGPSRRALPRDTRTHLSTWVSRNQLAVVGFPDRARELVPDVRAGIRYGIRCGSLTLSDQRLYAEQVAAPGAGPLGELLRAGAFAGRWLAKIDKPATAYALFGVSP